MTSSPDEEKIDLHQRYERGELCEEAVSVLIGDGLKEIKRERKAFQEATELDTTGVFQQ